MSTSSRWPTCSNIFHFEELLAETQMVPYRFQSGVPWCKWCRGVQKLHPLVICTHPYDTLCISLHILRSFVMIQSFKLLASCPLSSRGQPFLWVHNSYVIDIRKFSKQIFVQLSLRYLHTITRGTTEAARWRPMYGLDPLPVTWKQTWKHNGRTYITAFLNR